MNIYAFATFVIGVLVTFMIGRLSARWSIRRSMPIIPTWKIVKIGTHKSVEDLSKALTSNGFYITDTEAVAYLLKQIQLPKHETEVELVLVTVAELGFKSPARRDDIYHRAKIAGFSIVPAEVVAQLCLAYSGQPMAANIGMEPIVNSYRNRCLFSVACSERGAWLGYSFGDPDEEWCLDSCWVFARRRN